MKDKTIPLSKLRAQERNKKREEEFLSNLKAVEALKTKKTPKSVIKASNKFDIEKIASLFNYLGNIDYDPSWKPRAYVKERQAKEFFQKFVYRYSIPETLLMTSIESFHKVPFQITIPSTFEGYGSTKRTIKGCELAQIFVLDIISGKSFYKNNKSFFTKKESHFFLNIKNLSTIQDFTKAIILSKVNAKSVIPIMKDKVTTMLVEKHFEPFNEFTSDIIDFFARFPEINWDQNEINEIGDFLYSKINHNFTLVGRTPNSLIELNNIWHAETSKKPFTHSKWEGLPVENGEVETEAFIYNIKQILTSKELHTEGKKMHHCVGSYESKCSGGFSGIFSTTRTRKNGDGLESVATIEVSNNGDIMQCKGPCNKNIDKDTKKAIDVWRFKNSLRMIRY